MSALVSPACGRASGEFSIITATGWRLAKSAETKTPLVRLAVWVVEAFFFVVTVAVSPTGACLVTNKKIARKGTTITNGHPNKKKFPVIYNRDVSNHFTTLIFSLKLEMKNSLKRLVSPSIAPRYQTIQFAPST